MRLRGRPRGLPVRLTPGAPLWTRDSFRSIAGAGNPGDPEGILYDFSRPSAERRFGVANRGKCIGRAAEVATHVTSIIDSPGHISYRVGEARGALDRCPRLGPEGAARTIRAESRGAGVFVQWDRESSDRHAYFHSTGTRYVGQRPFSPVAHSAHNCRAPTGRRSLLSPPHSVYGCPQGMYRVRDHDKR